MRQKSAKRGADTPMAIDRETTGIGRINATCLLVGARQVVLHGLDT